MFVTYHRIGRSAVLPALAAAGVLVMVGGIAAAITVTILIIVGVVACGIKLLRALGIGGTDLTTTHLPDRPDTIEGIVVNRSSAVSERLQRREPALSRAEGPR